MKRIAKIVLVVAGFAAGCDGAVAGTDRYLCGPVTAWRVTDQEDYTPLPIMVRGFPMFIPTDGPALEVPRDAKEVVLIDAPLEGAIECSARSGKITTIGYDLEYYDNQGQRIWSIYAEDVRFELRVNGVPHPGDQFEARGGGGSWKQVPRGCSYSWVMEDNPLEFQPTPRQVQYVITNWGKRPPQTAFVYIVWAKYLEYEIEGMKYEHSPTALRWTVQVMP